MLSLHSFSYNYVFELLPVVVIATILDEFQSHTNDCYIRYRVLICQVIRGESFQVGSSVTLKVLPVGGCSDPVFEYVEDYLIGGFQHRGGLVVEKKGFVQDCAAYTPRFLDQCRSPWTPEVAA